MKSNALQVESRVSEILLQIIQGNSRKNIVQTFSKKYCLSDRQIDGYISKAKTYIKDLTDHERTYQISLAVHRLTEIFHVAFSRNDLVNALSAQRELNRLFGLYAPDRVEQKIELTQKDKEDLNSFDDLEFMTFEEK